eukprot:scaffold75738_cov97-Cyclotella_meneghiniana.AAC.4
MSFALRVGSFFGYGSLSRFTSGSFAQFKMDHSSSLSVHYLNSQRFIRSCYARFILSFGSRPQFTSVHSLGSRRFTL